MLAKMYIKKHQARIEYVNISTHTSLFGLFVVGFADKFVVFHKVKLISGVELPLTDDAGEAV